MTDSQVVAIIILAFFTALNFVDTARITHRVNLLHRINTETLAVLLKQEEEIDGLRKSLIDVTRICKRLNER